jgi:hypothetical protein
MSWHLSPTHKCEKDCNAGRKGFACDAKLILVRVWRVALLTGRVFLHSGFKSDKADLAVCLASIDLTARIFVSLRTEIFRKTSWFNLGPGKLMKQFVLALLVALSLGGCNSETLTQQAQTAAGGVWNAELLGGAGEASGFSFITEFTLNITGNGSLNVQYFEFLTQHPSGSCDFPLTGEIPTGRMTLNTNTSTGEETGPFSFTVKGTTATNTAGDTLTLTGTVNGFVDTSESALTSASSITGTWTVSGSSACTGNGTFTMTQQPSTTTTTGSGSSGT